MFVEPHARGLWLVSALVAGTFRLVFVFSRFGVGLRLRVALVAVRKEFYIADIWHV